MRLAAHCNQYSMINIKHLCVAITMLFSVSGAFAWDGDISGKELGADAEGRSLPLAVRQHDVTPAYIDSLAVEDDWQRKMHIKTNVLGWGLLITNLSLEVDIAKHWSFALPVYFSGWDYFSPTVKFRTLSFQPEVRYHFKETDGWFVGAHFGLTYFNLATDGEYRLQDRDGDTPAIGGGVAVGYRTSLTKNKRWKMEFSVGGGVYDVHYDRFRNKENGFLVDTKDKLYIGPDQASVTISYSFNLSKGGEKK